MPDDGYLESRLPKSKAARVRLVLKDSKRFVRRMGSEDVDRLLFSLSKTDGLSTNELAELKQTRYNVPLQYLPEHLRRDHT